MQIVNEYNLPSLPLLFCLNTKYSWRYDNVWIKLSVRHLNIVFSFPPLGGGEVSHRPVATCTCHCSFLCRLGSKLISPAAAALHKPICRRPAQRGGTWGRDCFTRVPSISTFPYIICLASCSTFILYKQTFIRCRWRWNFNIGEGV